MTESTFLFRLLSWISPGSPRPKGRGIRKLDVQAKLRIRKKKKQKIKKRLRMDLRLLLFGCNDPRDHLDDKGVLRLQITFRDTRLIFTYRQDRAEGEENAPRECEWDAIAWRGDGQVTVEVNAVEGPFRKWLQITDFRAERLRRTAFTSSRLLVTLFARCYTVSGDQWPFSNGHFRKILSGTMWYHGSRRHLHNRDIIPAILLARMFFPTWTLEFYLLRAILL
jgi:hypothetical protein